MTDPLSTVSGKGPNVTASLVNTQAQVQTAKTQAVADTVGIRKSLNMAVSNAGNAVNNDVTKDVTRTNAPNETDEKGQPITSREVSENKPSVILEADLKKAAETFKDYLDKLPSDLKFNFDEDTDRLILKIVNPVTKEVVKQYPPEELLSMAKHLREMTKNFEDNGVFLDTRS